MSFVGRVYADQKRSPAVRQALGKCLARLQDPGKGLQIGAAQTRLHSAVFNLDLNYNSELDCCARAESLPFRSGCFELVVAQEVLEHVEGLRSAMSEMRRVLCERGTAYCQIPFVLGYHSAPTDFWRFSRQGIRQVFCEMGFDIEELGMSVGPAVGFYRIAVEFGAILASCISPMMYRPAKGTMALLLYPVKWLDPFLSRSPEADRIAGGYFVIARKRQDDVAGCHELQYGINARTN